MASISPTQRRVLAAACKQPKVDVREHMRDIKSPAIRDKVVESMLKHGLIAEDPDADGVAYVISDKGFTVIGKTRAKTKAATKAAPKQAARSVARKEGGVSKQQVIIDLLSRKEGATSLQLQNATGWQKHSVRGAVSNLQRKLKLPVSAARNAGGELVYRIA